MIIIWAKGGRRQIGVSLFVLDLYVRETYKCEGCGKIYRMTHMKYMKKHGKCRRCGEKLQLMELIKR